VSEVPRLLTRYALPNGISMQPPVASGIMVTNALQWRGSRTGARARSMQDDRKANTMERIRLTS
jgi:hypothetical protein